jgi:5-keto 4-deoxyuronate isomerase
MGAYSLKYNGDACPTIALTQDVPPYANGGWAPVGTKGAEVTIKDNTVYLPNRNDKYFGPENDSITQYNINPATGAITWAAVTPAHGWYPRTFVINKAGNFAAIGGQTTANVAIVKRNPVTGALGQLVSNLRILSRGEPESETGVSTVVWIE